MKGAAAVKVYKRPENRHECDGQEEFVVCGCCVLSC